MKNKLYVLTSTVNDYNQYGEYFIACWLEKPTFEKLKSIISYDHLIDELLEKGEVEEYILSEYIEGEIYQNLYY